MQRSIAAESWADLLDLTLEHQGDRPLYQRLYLNLRQAITTGVLSSGRKLPSTRHLSLSLKVSRMSVVTAYEQLLSEGYVVARKGAGTFVCNDLPIAVSAARRVATATPVAAGLSTTGRRYGQFANDLAVADAQPFGTGYCSIDDATIRAWRRVGAQAVRRLDVTRLGYADALGSEALRHEVAAYLRAARAVTCEPNQIFIVSGTQQAIDLTARALLDPGDRVWIEDPGYLPTRAALVGFGVHPVAVPIDEHGLIVSEGRVRAASARAAFITPSHQYPTGAVMPLVRRLELLSWAAEHGAWIIEDDYDSEFRYVGRPLASLQGLDRGAHVIYVGTLNKVLFPGIRIGYVVVPQPLVDGFRAVRTLIDRHPPGLTQTIIAELMRQGALSRHIRRMRQLYRDARDALVEAIDQHMGDLVDVRTPDGGLQLLVKFKPGISDIRVADAARRRGVVVKPISPLYSDVTPEHGLVLGFSGFGVTHLQVAARELATATRSVIHRQRRD
jgi:GntR family transcriptional regulator / MocR family aminotransferase